MFSTNILLRKKSTEICHCYLFLEKIKQNKSCINNILFELSRLETPKSCINNILFELSRLEPPCQIPVHLLGPSVGSPEKGLLNSNSPPLASAFPRTLPEASAAPRTHAKEDASKVDFAEAAVYDLYIEEENSHNLDSHFFKDNNNK